MNAIEHVERFEHFEQIERFWTLEHWTLERSGAPNRVQR